MRSKKADADQLALFIDRTNETVYSVTNHRKLVECLVKVNPDLATEIWQGMPCAILVLNSKSLTILELNPQAEILFALSRIELIGKTVETFFRDDGCVQDLHQLTDGINSPGSCVTSSIKG